MPRAEADLTLARQDHERYQRLARDDFASEQRFQTATADLKKAEATLDRDAGGARVGPQSAAPCYRRSSLEAEAEGRQAEASLDLARTNLERTVIRAPEAGVIGNKGVRVGELVRPGNQLMALVPLPEVYVVANFKETQLDRMRPGQPVELEIDALPGSRFEGRVESFAPGTGLRVQPAATRERDRQLHQDRPAGAGPHRGPNRRPALTTDAEARHGRTKIGVRGIVPAGIGSTRAIGRPRLVITTSPCSRSIRSSSGRAARISRKLNLCMPRSRWVTQTGY